MWRFLDNDLISPHADRHDSLSMIAAACVVPPVLVTVLVCFKYVFIPHTPGELALLAVPDRFLYIAYSMIVMAALAVVVWDALALDARDTAILGPLPIQRTAVVRAKLGSVASLALGFVIILNVGPSVLFPPLLVYNLPVGLPQAFKLVVVHAAMTIAAGMFGFMAVLAVRELLHAALGAARFRRISALVQAALAVFVISTLLLLPGLASRVCDWCSDPEGLARYAVPPFWFLGLYETAAADVVLAFPEPAGTSGSPSRIARNLQAVAIYRTQQPFFRDVAATAVAALVIAALLAMGGYTWNTRRLPPPAVAPSSRRRIRRALVVVARQCIVRRPLAQAGFFFTLHTLVRSAPHRLAMATSLAAGLAAAIVAAQRVDIQLASGTQSAQTTVLAVQMMLAAALLVGIRHALGIPAELRANWAIQLAWSGDERPFLSGLKRAVGVGLILPLMSGLLPVHALLVGPRVAVAHFLCGVLAAFVLLDVLLLSFRKMPFACTYVPDSNLTVRWPLYVVTYALLTYAFAWIEQIALRQSGTTMTLLGGLVVLFVGIRLVDVFRRRERAAIDFDELPGSVQRLGLME